LNEWQANPGSPARRPGLPGPHSAARTNTLVLGLNEARPETPVKQRFQWQSAFSRLANKHAQKPLSRASGIAVLFATSEVRSRSRRPRLGTVQTARRTNHLNSRDPTQNESPRRRPAIPSTISPPQNRKDSGRRILARLPAPLGCRTPQLGVTSTSITCRCSHEDRVAETLVAILSAPKHVAQQHESPPRIGTLRSTAALGYLIGTKLDLSSSGNKLSATTLASKRSLSVLSREVQLPGPQEPCRLIRRLPPREALLYHQPGTLGDLAQVRPDPGPPQATFG